MIIRIKNKIYVLKFSLIDLFDLFFYSTLLVSAIKRDEKLFNIIVFLFVVKIVLQIISIIKKNKMT